MRKTLSVVGLTLLVSLASCADHTKYGQCIGAFDKQDTHYDYKLSKLNTVLSIVFVETIFVPVIVVADETQCPYRPAHKN